MLKVISDDELILKARLEALKWAEGKPSDAYWSAARSVEKYLLTGISPDLAGVPEAAE